MALIAVVGIFLAIDRARTRQVETLRSPIDVEGWSASGLHLAGGRVLQLPGFEALPSTSAALTEVTKRGIEVGDDGRVYGLLRVHHWCGNDPIREHIARVDVALVLIYLGEGKSFEQIPRPPWSLANASTAFSEFGWRIEEFRGFVSWRESRVANLALQRTGPAAALPGHATVTLSGPVR